MTSKRTFEDLLQDLGGLGKFQVMMFLVVNMGDINFAWSLYMMQFSGATPDFHCRLENSTAGNDDINVCHVNDTSCSSYDFTGSMKTVVTEWDLVCGDRFGKQIIISLQMVGMFLGVLVSGQLCKFYGRKVTLYSAQVFMMAMNLIAAFSVSWIMYAVLRFFVGLGAGVYSIPCFLFTVEFVPGKYRILDIFRLFLFVGTSLLALVAYNLNDWFLLQIVNVAISLPAVLFGWYFVPESVRWLTINGRIDESMKVLDRISVMNGRRLPSDANDILHCILLKKQQTYEENEGVSFSDIFRNTDMIKISTISWAVMFSLGVSITGLLFEVSNLFGNLYVNIFLISLFRFLFYFPSLFIMLRYGRKPTMVTWISMSAVASMVCLLMVSIAFGSTKQVTVVSLLATMSSNTSLVILFVWVPEMYPSVIRSLGFSWTQSGYRIGSVVAPFLINLDSAPEISYTIISVLFGLSVLGCFLLPETKEVPLSTSFDNNETCTDEKVIPGNKVVPVSGE